MRRWRSLARDRGLPYALDVPDDEDPPPPVSERPTRALSRDEILGAENMSVAIVMAALERLSPWASYAFRLGLLTLLRQAVTEMTAPDAGPEHIVRVRELVELLARMPWEA